MRALSDKGIWRHNGCPHCPAGSYPTAFWRCYRPTTRHPESCLFNVQFFVAFFSIVQQNKILICKTFLIKSTIKKQESSLFYLLVRLFHLDVFWAIEVGPTNWIFKKILYYFNVHKCIACTCVCAPVSHNAYRVSKDGFEFPGTGIKVGC